MPLNRLFDSGQPITPPPDVQRTSLGIDVLSRFVCNTWDEATAGSTRQFDAVVIGAGMFGGYCADKIFRFGEANGLKVLVLDAGPFLVGTHVQNLPNAGLNVPGPITPSNDPGVPRELVWGIPWRGNVDFIGQAYCIGGKSLYWGGWCPRLLRAILLRGHPRWRSTSTRTTRCWNSKPASMSKPTSSRVPCSAFSSSESLVSFRMAPSPISIQLTIPHSQFKGSRHRRDSSASINTRAQPY